MKNNDEASLKDVIVTISDYKNEFKKRLLLIISIAIIFSLLGYGYSKLQENKYTAVVSFIVEDQSDGANLSDISGAASQFGFDIGGNSSSSLSQQDVIELLKSRLIIEKTLNNKCEIGGKSDLLLNHYIRINNLITDSSEINFSANYKDSITTVVYSTINEEDMNILFQNDEANILNLSFTSLNPEFAKHFSEIIIDEMTKDYKKNETEKSRIILNKLEKRAESVKIELISAQENLEDVLYHLQYSNRYANSKGKLADSKLKFASDTLRYKCEYLGADYKYLREYITITNMTLLDETPLIQIVDKSVLPLTKSK